jgi:hAT family C-terminal dimerisation region
MLSVDFTFKRLYPTEEVGTRIEKVIQTLKSLYDKYLKERMTSKVIANTSNPAVSNLNPTVRKMAKKDYDFYAYLKSMEVENPPKSDLEVYLGEPIYVVEDENSFDVLKWWSQNCSKYHVLSKLARDVLCIPITTVTSESAFSAGGRVLDDYRSSLKQDMVEILVCGGNWLKSISKTTIQTLEKNFSFVS